MCESKLEFSRGGEGWGFPGVQHVTFQSHRNRFSRELTSPL